MSKCHSQYVPQQEQVLLGLLVNKAGALGEEKRWLLISVSNCLKLLDWLQLLRTLMDLSGVVGKDKSSLPFLASQ